MSNRYLISVAAAALIAGAGMANAQNSGPAGQSGATTQQAPPSSGGAASGGAMTREPSQTGAPASAGAKAGDSMSREGASGQRAQDGQTPKSMSSDSKSGAPAKDMKAEDGARKGNTNAESTKSGAADSKSAADTKAGATDSKTTGNAATSATAAPPAEKRTQIVSAIKSQKVEEVTNVNFNISVGTRVPTSVRYHALPPRIVEIYPEWRGYDFIVVRGQYIILRPETHEIVYIIEG